MQLLKDLLTLNFYLTLNFTNNFYKTKAITSALELKNILGYKKSRRKIINIKNHGVVTLNINPVLKIENIHIYVACLSRLFVCLFVSLYQINVITAELIGPTFCVRPPMTQDADAQNFSSVFSKTSKIP